MKKRGARVQLPLFGAELARPLSDDASPTAESMELVRSWSDTSALDMAQGTRPQIRAQCSTEARPCPWVSCRYHLALEATNTAVHLNGPAGQRGRRPSLQASAPATESVPWLEQAATSLFFASATCALDVADDGPSCEGVERGLGMTKNAATRAIASAVKAFAEACRAVDISPSEGLLALKLDVESNQGSDT